MRVGLLGYGFAGKTIHAPLICSVAGLELIRMMSGHAADEVIDDPAVDLIVIATPNATHYDLARRALLAGKHVVVDKPFTVTVAEARALIDLAAQRRRFLSVFHSRRFDGDFLTVRALLERRELGDLAQFESHYDRFRPVVQNRWRERAEPGSGIWFDLGAHLVDQTLQLFGMPDFISGDLAVQREGGQAIDYFHVILRYGKMRAILHGANLAAAETPRFVLHGDTASFVKYGMDTQEPALRRGELPGSAGWGEDSRNGIVTTADGSHPIDTIPGDYRAFYEAVRDAIENGGPNPVPPEQALLVMQVLEQVNSEHGVEPFPHPR